MLHNSKKHINPVRLREQKLKQIRKLLHKMPFERTGADIDVILEGLKLFPILTKQVLSGMAVAGFRHANQTLLSLRRSIILLFNKPDYPSIYTSIPPVTHPTIPFLAAALKGMNS